MVEDREASSAARSLRALAAPVLMFDFVAEVDRLRREAPWLERGRNAVTLVKQPDFRIVFMIMKQGARLEEHHANGTISLQALSGHLRLHLKEQIIELPAGHLVALERDLPHDVEAIEESHLLLTIAWSGGAPDN